MTIFADTNWLAAAGGGVAGALFHDREPWHGHRNGVLPDGRAAALQEGP